MTWPERWAGACLVFASLAGCEGIGGGLRGAAGPVAPGSTTSQGVQVIFCTTLPAFLDGGGAGVSDWIPAPQPVQSLEYRIAASGDAPSYTIEWRNRYSEAINFSFRTGLEGTPTGTTRRISDLRQGTTSGASEAFVQGAPDGPGCVKIAQIRFGADQGPYWGR